MIAPNIIWGVWSPDTNPNTVFEGVWSCRDSESGLAPRRDPETDPILSHWAISGRRSRIFQRWIYTCVPANDEYRHWCPSWTHPFHAQGALGLHMGIRAQLEGRNMARRGSDCQPNYGHVTMDPCPSWAFFFGGGQNCKKNNWDGETSVKLGIVDGAMLGDPNRWQAKFIIQSPSHPDVAVKCSLRQKKYGWKIQELNLEVWEGKPSKSMVDFPASHDETGGVRTSGPKDHHVVGFSST